MTTLSILVPVLKRPQNVRPLIESVWEGTTGTSFEIVFITSTNDDPEVMAVMEAVGDYGPVIQLFQVPGPRPGDYARKINHAYCNTDGEWLFLGADDIRFRPGWFQNAVKVYHQTGKRVIGTQDLGNGRVTAGTHSTHTLVHRSYVEECGTVDERNKILHEGYPHEFVDDEFIETAKLRDEFVMSWDSVVEHLHPLWGKAPTDELYAGHVRRMMQGRRLYQRRRRLWKQR